MVRPNFPMLGDDAAALLSASTGWTKSVLKFALLSFVHFDLNGHGANNAMVVDRKRTFDPNVFVWKRHCGKHATG